jgi:hypothetical protein
MFFRKIEKGNSLIELGHNLKKGWGWIMTILGSSGITGYLGWLKDFPLVYIWLFILVTILIILMIKNQLSYKNKAKNNNEGIMKNKKEKFIKDYLKDISAAKFEDVNIDFDDLTLPVKATLLIGARKEGIELSSIELERLTASTLIHMCKCVIGEVKKRYKKALEEEKS